MRHDGPIVADADSSMDVRGTYDARWSNGVLDHASRALTASDFETIQLRIQRLLGPTNLRAVDLQ